MKVVVATCPAASRLIKAREIPVGRFATSPAAAPHVVYLRTAGIQLVRFRNGESPESYPCETYDEQRFEVLPEDFSITIGGN